MISLGHKTAMNYYYILFRKPFRIKKEIEHLTKYLGAVGNTMLSCIRLYWHQQGKRFERMRKLWQ